MSLDGRTRLNSKMAKQGRLVLGLGMPIVALEGPRLLLFALIVIVSHNYMRQICAVLRTENARA